MRATHSAGPLKRARRSPNRRYHLGFTLSNLGEFDAALRATKRALELDPYYVAQRYELAIDLQYDETEFTVTPEIGGDQRATTIEEFTFNVSELDSLFDHLTPVVVPTQVQKGSAPLDMARDYLSKGLYDRAIAEASRALSRGADRGEGLAVLGEAYERQGLFGEALERYREARTADASVSSALAGEVRCCCRRTRGRCAPARGAAVVARAAHAGHAPAARGIRDRRRATRHWRSKRCTPRRPVAPSARMFRASSAMCCAQWGT